MTQTQAEQLEREKVIARVHLLQAILGQEPTSFSDLIPLVAIKSLVQRLENQVGKVSANAAQPQPITLGEYQQGK